MAARKEAAASPFFLPLTQGARFCIYHAAGVAPAKRGLVYVHPFAEEMHKARRMAALQSRLLAARGCCVLQIDLYGCGDSSGDFVDARWQEWANDVRQAIRWLKARGVAKVALWGLRLGATLAADVARDAAIGIDHLTLWQPVADGDQYLSQFLRLRLAGEMLAAGSASTALAELRRELKRGTSVEVAGCELHPDLASSIAGMQLASAVPAVRTVHWFEVSEQAGTRVRPASLRVEQAWRAREVHVSSQVVAGEPFWSTAEIAECPALLGATAEAFSALP